MTIEPSPALERALAGARHLAAPGEVSPEHLLRALLAEEEGPVWNLLRQAGVDESHLPWTDLPPKNPPHGTAGELGMEVQKALARARELARWHSPEGTVTTDQVFLALLECRPVLLDPLRAAGLDPSLLPSSADLEPPALHLDEPLDLDRGGPDPRLHRLIDAVANRAREALRVLEDHTRFILNDGTLSRELKEMRHELAAVLAGWPAETLAAARDILHDVGAGITTAAERTRSSLQAVVQANARRLEEALRSLEEFSKLEDADAGARMEKLRYRAYAVEKALLLRQPSPRLAQARLYALVTESQCRASLLGTVREILEGGVQVVQLREKNRPDGEILPLAREIRKLTRDFEALFIVNDRPDLALLAEADGVHLGQEDLPLAEARALLGAGKLLGLSTHSPVQVRQAVLEGAAYIGVGPTFPSRTKDFPELAGLEFVRAAHAATSLPAFVLGGVTLDNLPQVLEAGGRRVAVSQALCAAADPREEATRFRRLLDAVPVEATAAPPTFP